MERNLLGMNVVRKEQNDYQEAAKLGDFRSLFLEETMERRCSNYSAFAESSQRPFLSKGQSQQFVSSKGGVEEVRPKKIAYHPLGKSGQRVISTADAFQAHHRASKTTNKKNFTMDAHFPQLGQGSHFGLPCSTYPVPTMVQGTSMPDFHIPDVRAAPIVNHHPISAGTPTVSPYYRIYGASGSATANSLASVNPYGGIPATAHDAKLPIVGLVSKSANNTRTVPSVVLKLPTSTAQLTIFYAGSVHVYDNVSAEKAEEIMFLAGQRASSTGRSTQINLANLVSPTVKPSPDGLHVKTMISSGSGLSIPTSGANITDQTQKSAGGSNCTNEMSGVKAIGHLACKAQSEPSKMAAAVSGSPFILTVGVPQARKASLTRFLKMRKERLAGASPYPKPPEICNQKNIERVAIRNTSLPTTAEHE